MVRAVPFVAFSLILFAGIPLARAQQSPTRTALAISIPDVRFANVPLGDCIDFLHDVSGANIVVDWKTLTAAGVSQDSPVDVRLKNVSLRAVLNIVLDQAAGNQPLSWYTDRDVIHITTRTEADAHVVTIVYDVRDLLVRPKNFMFNEGIGGGYLPPASATDPDDSDNLGPDQDKETQRLINMIESAVRPDAWSDHGGTTAYISMWHGSIIVTAPRQIQEAIGGPIN